MNLQKDEQIIKVFHHHTSTIIVRILKIVVASLPFFLVAYFISGALKPMHNFYMFGGVTLLFGSIMFYDFIIYYMDRLIITNRRVVHIDWQGALQRYEHEAEIGDIQDIATKEAGILSFFKIFDYGDFVLETASAHTTIEFLNAPDPEGIKHFIYHLNIKPNRIGNDGLSTSDDKTRQTEETHVVARRQ